MRSNFISLILVFITLFCKSPRYEEIYIELEKKGNNESYELPDIKSILTGIETVYISEPYQAISELKKDLYFLGSDSDKLIEVVSTEDYFAAYFIKNKKIEKRILIRQDYSDIFIKWIGRLYFFQGNPYKVN